MTSPPSGGGAGGNAGWVLRAMRGWPADLPADPALVGSMLEELEQPAVREAITERLRQAGGERGRFPVALAAAESGLWIPLILLWFIAGPWAAAAWLAVLVPAEVFIWRRTLRQWMHPRLRALLRGHGIDACLDCGALGPGEAPAAPCGRCGCEHDAVPLGWLDDAPAG